MLFDNISGVVKYFYDKNEPNSGVTKSFDTLLSKAKNGTLPKDLSALLKQTIVNFPEMRSRRVDLEHYYESLLISFRHDEEGKTILGHFRTKYRPIKEYEDIRQYFGSILCEYQTLSDSLLDHFDAKFMDWYARVFTLNGLLTVVLDISVSGSTLAQNRGGRKFTPKPILPISQSLMIAPNKSVELTACISRVFVKGSADSQLIRAAAHFHVGPK